MRDRKAARSPFTFTQMLVGIAIIVGFFMAFGLNQNATNLQKVQASEGTFQAEVDAQATIEVELNATLDYVQSAAYIEDFNRTEANKVLPGEVKVVPLILQATPQPIPQPTATPNVSTHAKPWQMWWYLLTDVEAPVVDEPLDVEQ